MPRDEDEDDRPRRRKRRDEDEDEDDRPRSRRDEEDEDERPRRRRRDEDEDEDDRPRRRQRREDDEDDEDDYGPRRRLSRETLRAIAVNQKVLLFCILVYVCLILATFASPDNVRLVLGLALIPVFLTAAVFVFLLATKVYSTAVGVVLAIFTLIPCIGLLVLLIINGKATSVLKENGIRVGLLGANSSDI